MIRTIQLLPDEIHHPGDLMAVQGPQSVVLEPINPMHYGQPVGEGSPCFRQMNVIIFPLTAPPAGEGLIPPKNRLRLPNPPATIPKFP